MRSRSTTLGTIVTTNGNNAVSTPLSPLAGSPSPHAKAGHHVTTSPPSSPAREHQIKVVLTKQQIPNQNGFTQPGMGSADALLSRAEAGRPDKNLLRTHRSPLGSSSPTKASFKRERALSLHASSSPRGNDMQLSSLLSRFLPRRSPEMEPDIENNLEASAFTIVETNHLDSKPSLSGRRNAPAKGGPVARGVFRYPNNMFALLGIFCAGVFLLYVLWHSLARHLTDGHDLKFPTSLDVIREDHDTILYLSQYPIFWVFYSCLYIFKQAFVIPGSWMLNVIAGAALGVFWAWPLCVILNTTGAWCCSLLSLLVAGEWIAQIGPSSERKLERKIYDLKLKARALKQEGHFSLFMYLVSIRLFPVTPHWLLNLSLPHLGCPHYIFWCSMAIGCSGYNLLTTSAGTMLTRIKSTRDIFDITTLVRFAILAICIAACNPALQAVKRRISSAAQDVERQD